MSSQFTPPRELGNVNTVVPDFAFINLHAASSAIASGFDGHRMRLRWPMKPLAFFHTKTGTCLAVLIYSCNFAAKRKTGLPENCVGLTCKNMTAYGNGKNHSGEKLAEKL